MTFDASAHRERRIHCGEAVLIVDVDRFDAVRERHGTAAAEQVTRAVAQCLQRRLRSEDRLALLREDEFLVVLAGGPPGGAAGLPPPPPGQRPALRP
ncbi:MAG TPA: diguanylate cyclase, partial [Burkholderiaceae bacterium]|nr:diguanylate cyclase [Burkholderiaceae bacterium]